MKVSATRTGIPTPTRSPSSTAWREDPWRTDQHGTITISFTGQGAVVASER
jgi:hypothetical protein